MLMVYGDKKQVVLEQDCPFCGQAIQGCFDTSAFEAWRNGTLIQDAMPYVPATAREWLISGICPECQDKVFGEEA